MLDNKFLNTCQVCNAEIAENSLCDDCIMKIQILAYKSGYVQEPSDDFKRKPDGVWQTKMLRALR